MKSNLKCSDKWLRQQIKDKITILHCATGRIDAKTGHPELKPLRLISEHTVLGLLDEREKELLEKIGETQKEIDKGYSVVNRERETEIRCWSEVLG